MLILLIPGGINPVLGIFGSVSLILFSDFLQMKLIGILFFEIRNGFAPFISLKLLKNNKLTFLTDYIYLFVPLHLKEHSHNIEPTYCNNEKLLFFYIVNINPDKCHS